MVSDLDEIRANGLTTEWVIYKFIVVYEDPTASCANDRILTSNSNSLTSLLGQANSLVSTSASASNPPLSLIGSEDYDFDIPRN